MENLLNCDGRRFRAKIEGVECEGKVRVEDGDVYLCQNAKSGVCCQDKFGYNFSWQVADGDVDNLRHNQVTEFRLISMTPSEIESYKDWQVGDKIRKDDDLMEVIFRSGKFVVCEMYGGYAYSNYTCDELYRRGWRLVSDPAPEDDTVELTMDEIAAKVEVPVEKLRIKKEEK